MNGGAESLPYAPVPFVLLEHALGMELQAHHKSISRIVESLNQAILGMGHGLKVTA